MLGTNTRERRAVCSRPSGRRRATVSYVLYYKAFLGYTFERIASMGMPHGGKVSRQRVHDFFEQAVQDVAMEARKEGRV